MGANVYLEAVASYGYNTETAATAIVQGIQPREGERIAIRSYGLTAGTSATLVYFMQCLGTSTIDGAVTSGSTTGLALASEPGPAGNTLISNDYIAIQVDDGTVHFSMIATGTYGNFSLSTALDDSVADGNRAWWFGAYGDEGHLQVNVAASTQEQETIDGGIFYANAKGYPMICYHANDVAGSAGSIDWLTIDYLNK